ncbi:hypothetical protein CN090_04240 [Sinorhizobium meliloti]|uniref:hypothetical protein n=1 Tax=Rhizobium meliloti TaxID=382 RepID=UPI000FD90633|nr:hypothetical protein [Sinorhizobium meliloti]RVO55132.1 hypothetical protein CN090_04240 [Sinorhizobium meliloti]
MAFNLSNLTSASTALAAAVVGRVFDYSTSDTISDVEALDGDGLQIYFIGFDACLSFRPNDVIRVSGSDGKGLYIVVTSSRPIAGGRVEFKKLASVIAFA